MEQSDFQRFRSVLAGMAELYQRELSNPLLDAYWLSLKKWPLADFEAAAAHLMATATFMPRPSDFNALRKAGDRTAGEAWADALSHCTSWRGGVTAGGRVDRAVQAVGGYRVIAMADAETALPHIERRFKEAYEELTDVEEARQQIPQIAMSGMQERISGPKVDEAVPSLLQIGQTFRR